MNLNVDFLRRPWRIAALLLLVFLFATAVYRAATQSISHDEGLIYEWYLAGPWRNLIEVQSGNHHVLSDILVKAMMSVFGISEIAMRVPSLFGGALYFYSVYALSLLLFGEGALFFLAVAFLSSNPLLLDYFSVARGYGLALGFFFYAFLQMARCFWFDASKRALGKAGIGLGLAVGSNVIMIFPGAALAVSMFGWYLADGVLHAKRQRNRWGDVLLYFVLPAVAIGGAISAIPKQLIEAPGYMGPASLLLALNGIVTFSILHSSLGIRGFASFVPGDELIRAVTYVGVPALLAGLFAIALRIAAGWVKRGLDELAGIDRFLLLLAGMIPSGIAMIVASRYLFGQAYPEMRTIVYWIPLLCLAALGMLRWTMERAKPVRLLEMPLAVLIAVFAVQFASQFNTRFFAEWAYCAAGKDMMLAVVAEHNQNPSGRVRLGVSWPLEPVVNFYRTTWDLNWLDAVDREGPDRDFDFFLLMADDLPLVEGRGLQMLKSDDLSRVVLARRR